MLTQAAAICIVGYFFYACIKTMVPTPKYKIVKVEEDEEDFEWESARHARRRRA